MQQQPEPLDAATLAALTSLGKSTGHDLLHELAQLFVNSGLLEEIQAAKAAGDATKLGDLAHQLRGSSSTMGALHLSSLCHEIEKRCRQSDPPSTEDLEPLAREYARVATLLQEL